MTDPSIGAMWRESLIDVSSSGLPVSGFGNGDGNITESSDM